MKTNSCTLYFYFSFSIMISRAWVRSLSMVSKNTSTNTERTSSASLTSNTKNIFKTFTQHVTLKFDENNFLLWKQQFEGIIFTHKFHCLLVNPTIPPCYLTKDREPDVLGLSQRSNAVLPRLIRYVHSH